MPSHVIPKEPDSLYLTVESLWNGEPCADEDAHAEVWVTRRQGGLQVRVHANRRDDARVPDAPRDSRVDGLWEYDVVELFFVGEDGTYTEVELGPGGHYLVLSFDDVRRRSDAYEGREFNHRNSSSTPGTWQSVIEIPWDALPKNVLRMNAFAIMGGQHLAWSPVPGTQPDFHQPTSFPEVRIAE